MSPVCSVNPNVEVPVGVYYKLLDNVQLDEGDSSMALAWPMGHTGRQGKECNLRVCTKNMLGKYGRILGK